MINNFINKENVVKIYNYLCNNNQTVKKFNNEQKQLLATDILNIMNNIYNNQQNNIIKSTYNINNFILDTYNIINNNLNNINNQNNQHNNINNDNIRDKNNNKKVEDNYQKLLNDRDIISNNKRPQTPDFSYDGSGNKNNNNLNNNINNNINNNLNNNVINNFTDVNLNNHLPDKVFYNRDVNLNKLNVGEAMTNKLSILDQMAIDNSDGMLIDNIDNKLIIDEKLSEQFNNVNVDERLKLLQSERKYENNQINTQNNNVINNPFNNNLINQNNQNNVINNTNLNNQNNVINNTNLNNQNNVINNNNNLNNQNNVINTNNLNNQNNVINTNNNLNNQQNNNLDTKIMNFLNELIKQLVIYQQNSLNEILDIKKSIKEMNNHEVDKVKIINDDLNKQLSQYKNDENIIDIKLKELELKKNNIMIEVDKINQYLIDKKKMEDRITNLINQNVRYIHNNNYNIIIDNNIYQFDNNIININNIEILNYDLPNKINNINKNNNYLNIEINNQIIEIYIKNNNYTIETLIDELNNKLSELNINIYLENDIVYMKCINEFKLLMTPLLNVLGFENIEIINNIYKSDNLNKLCNNKLLYVYFKNISDKCIAKIMIGSNNNQKINIKLDNVISELNYLEIEFRNQKNDIIYIDEFLIEISFKTIDISQL